MKPSKLTSCKSLAVDFQSKFVFFFANIVLSFLASTDVQLFCSRHWQHGSFDQIWHRRTAGMLSPSKVMKMDLPLESFKKNQCRFLMKIISKTDFYLIIIKLEGRGRILI